MIIRSRVAAKVAQSIRGKVFKDNFIFGNEFKKFSTASLITRTTNDIQQVQMVIVMMLRIVIYAPIMGIGGYESLILIHQCGLLVLLSHVFRNRFNTILCCYT